LNAPDLRLPSHETIRMWMRRVGLARLRSVEQKDGGTWLVDHTNQIGPEKVLCVLRVWSWPQGRALRHDDVEVLAVLPGTRWKRDDVLAAYRDIATRFGVPDSIVSDGAVELREPVEMLEIAGKTPRGFRDMKHFLANLFERVLNGDPDFASFSQRLGQSRSSLQQTELAHFTPPSFKPKARFMNIGPNLRWALGALWHMDHPESACRQTATTERFEEKLGWLRGYRAAITRWQNCQAVISTTLTLLNRRGLCRGVTQACRRRIERLAVCEASRQLADATLAQLQADEARLKLGERLPLSTEILESSFARYKQLEQQHSRSGFTGLLLAYPVLLRPTTATEVTASFGAVKVADVRAWTRTHLADTLTARKQRLYREANPKTKLTPNTRNRATPAASAG
jgi:hypothetical protein